MNVQTVSLPIDPPAQPKWLGARLSVLHFLQWAVWGLWGPILTRYLGAGVVKGGLGFSDLQIGLLFGVSGSVGAISAPFLVGQIADRHFRTERIMAGLLVIIGILWLIMAYQREFWAWMALFVAASIVGAPMIALSNSLSFAHMTDARRQFPRVRVWGTIGWIVVAWAFPMIWLQTDLEWIGLPPFFKGQEIAGVTSHQIDSLKAAGMLAFVYAAYCLTLPTTQPKRDARDRLAFRKAFGLFRRKSFAVLMLAGLMIAAIHSIYFIQTAKFLPTLGVRDSDIQPAMSVGQLAEIPMMVVVGYLLKHLGFRWVLTIGATAYVVRFAVFGTTHLPVELIIASQGLHGVCFACYYASAFIYVDRLADEDVRHSAQTVMGVFLGIGPILGGLLNGALAEAFTPEGGKIVDYSPFWYCVGGVGFVAMLLLALLFRDETKAKG